MFLGSFLLLTKTIKIELVKELVLGSFACAVRNMRRLESTGTAKKGTRRDVCLSMHVRRIMLKNVTRSP